MGQSPSAARVDGHGAGGVLGVGNGAKNRDDGRNGACFGGCGGCLPAPRFLFSRGGGGPTFETVEDGREDDDDDDIYGLVAVARAAAAAEEEPPPEDLVLTDVEDDDDEEEERQKGGDGTPPPLEDEEKAAGTEPEEEPPTTTIPDDLLSRLVAVDCGMVKLPRTTTNGTNGERRERSALNSDGRALRRACVVDGRGRPLLSALVRVERPSHRQRAADASSSSHEGYRTAAAHFLAGYLPRINGCGDDLDAGVTADEVRREAAELLRGKIVVGHSVDGDLAVLGLGIDEEGKGDGFEVRDTATYPPFLTQKGKPRTLRALVRERLGQEIQVEGKFHECEEDAVASLELYKSVWHEWEASLKVVGGDKKSINEQHGSLQRHQTAESEGSERQSRDSPVNQSARTGGKRNKKKKKKKRKKKGGRQQMEKAKPPAENLHRDPTGSSSRAPLETKPPTSENQDPLQYSGFTFRALFSPILFPARLSHDLVRLMRETAVSSLRLARQRRGYVFVPPAIFPNRMRGKKDKKRALRRRYHQIRRFVEGSVLGGHCVVEMCVVWSLLLLQCDNQRNTAASLHGANGAFAAALIGLGLLLTRSSGRQQEHGLQRRILFGILAQYHLARLFIGLASEGGGDGAAGPYALKVPSLSAMDRGMPWVVATSGLDEYAQHALLGAERVASTLARRLMGVATSAGVVTLPAIAASGEAVASVLGARSGDGVDVVLRRLVAVAHDGAVEFERARGTVAKASRSDAALLLACDLSFFCWFVFRAAKKR